MLKCSTNFSWWGAAFTAMGPEQNSVCPLISRITKISWRAESHLPFQQKWAEKICRARTTCRNVYKPRRRPRQIVSCWSATWKFTCRNHCKIHTDSADLWSITKLNFRSNAAQMAGPRCRAFLFGTRKVWRETGTEILMNSWTFRKSRRTKSISWSNGNSIALKTSLDFAKKGLPSLRGICF